MPSVNNVSEHASTFTKQKPVQDGNIFGAAKLFLKQVQRYQFATNIGSIIFVLGFQRNKSLALNLLKDQCSFFIPLCKY